jgi:Bacterial alpha-L-rhamnosidase 6 hairpin glycosidase domain/Alpha-L-rhamnosidase N-terminal domain/Bacterial alpha-L-rhamnosidase C-terminal domain
MLRRAASAARSSRPAVVAAVATRGARPVHRLRRVVLAGGIAAVTALAPSAVAAAQGSPARDHAPSTPTGLVVNDQRDPLAVQGSPAFGWLPQDRDANEIQTAYELRVRTSAGQQVWDSGRIRSSAQSWVAYAGPALAPGASYRWSVRTWDRAGRPSPGAAARFDTGLGDQDWSGAQWIRRTPAAGNDTANDWTLARRTLQVSQGSRVVRARAYVAAMGDWQLDVDGQAVDDTSSPNYPGEGYYDVSDVTALARAGAPLTVGVSYHYWTCKCQGRANGPAAPEGPSGLLVKVVVEHADGSKDVLVSDGSWKVTQNAAEQIGTLTYRNSDSGDRVEYLDAQRALTGWDLPSYDDSTWSAPAVIGPHPRPAAASCASFEGASAPCTFTHLVAQQAHLTKTVVHPVSVKTMPDGTVFADFGQVYSSVPSLRLQHGVAGRAVTVTTSYRENNTTSGAATPRGSRTVVLASVGNLHVGDGITMDAPAVGYGAGHPETRTVTAITGATVTLDRPLTSAHAAGVWVENTRAGTSKLDTQGSNMRFYYTERDGAQVAQPQKYWAWRYVQISAPGERLTAAGISAVVQHTEAPHPSTFSSSNTTLDKVFTLMQRSALYSAQDTFLDTPTREKGQFLGDTEDESRATVASLGERQLTRQAIVDFIASQNRYWANGAMNAVYPNGDAKRDIPDYTEMFPEWVLDYYQQTGDATLLAQAYPAMKKVADYIQTAVDATGLVYQLPGGSGPYAHGIIDWPAPMRYDTVVDGNGAETVVNALAVGANRSVAAAAGALGRTAEGTTYGTRATAITTAMNDRLVDPGTGLYSDGLATDTRVRLANTSEHAQSYAVAYGVAPTAAYPRLGAAMNADGMQQGPMDLRQLEAALGATGRTDTLVRILTDPNADGPAQTIAEGGTFMPEQWRPGCAVAGCSGTAVNQSDNSSMSHGWGAAGIVGIQQSLLGLTISGVGGSRVLVQPPSTGLAQARGSQWTERGRVSVAWHIRGHRVSVDVDVPVNVTAVVVVGGHRRTVGSGHWHLTG